MINARIESVAEKPSFRKAVTQRRCLVPMSSFFEWHTDEAGNKDPYRIYSKAAPFMVGAGIWEDWKRHGVSDSGPEQLTTFSLLTCDANPFMQKIHHRMPVVLEPEQQRNWLNPLIRTGTEAIQSLGNFQHDHPKNDRSEIWNPT